MVGLIFVPIGEGVSLVSSGSQIACFFSCSQICSSILNISKTLGMSCPKIIKFIGANLHGLKHYEQNFSCKNLLNDKSACNFNLLINKVKINKFYPKNISTSREYI